MYIHIILTLPLATIVISKAVRQYEDGNSISININGNRVYFSPLHTNQNYYGELINEKDDQNYQNPYGRLNKAGDYGASDDGHFHIGRIRYSSGKPCIWGFNRWGCGESDGVWSEWGPCKKPCVHGHGMKNRSCITLGRRTCRGPTSKPCYPNKLPCGKYGENEKRCEKKNPLESNLPNGNESVHNWIKTVDGLHRWEKNTMLGDAYFNTSARSEKARARFTLGLLALHNFMYDQATELFWQAREDEMECNKRDFPLALWGAALASQHILWKSSHCEKGREAVLIIPDNYKKYVTEREADFISTVFQMFPKDKKCEDENEDNREKRYTKAMGKVVKKYPDELEGQLLYLIAKFATMGHPDCSYGQKMYESCQREIKNIRERLNNYYKQYPTHSGIMHYIIHVDDSPDVFSKSIKKFTDELVDVEMQNSKRTSIIVSYKYMNLAKTSCHGQHMPSHLFMRIGNWKMSLKSNVASYEFWDEYANERGLNFTYDKSNLWHAVEYAQNDFLQLGRYKEASVLLQRIEDAVRVQSSMFDMNDERVRYYRQFHVKLIARQLLDGYTMKPKKYPDGEKRIGCLPPGQSVVTDNIKANSMIWAAIAESGIMLTSGLASARNYAKNADPHEYGIVKSCVHEIHELSKKLEGDKYKDTMQYTKEAVRMFYEILIGVVEIANMVKPNGFEKIGQLNDTEKEIILSGHLKKATIIQQESMRQTSATPTLLFIPSFEIYGHILLLFGKYSEAKEMFARTVQERMGRINGVIGLARSNAMLGNKKAATFFYKHVKEQLSEADKGNLYVKEAEVWLNYTFTKAKLWYWPYV